MFANIFGTSMCSLDFTSERIHVRNVTKLANESGIRRQIRIIRKNVELRGILGARKVRRCNSKEIDHHVYCTVTRCCINVDYIICCPSSGLERACFFCFFRLTSLNVAPIVVSKIHKFCVLVEKLIEICAKASHIQTHRHTDTQRIDIM